MPSSPGGSWDESTGDLAGGWNPEKVEDLWGNDESSVAREVDSPPYLGFDVPSLSRVPPSQFSAELELHLERSLPPDGSEGEGDRDRGPGERPLNYPQPGSVLAGFRLVTELGRGAFARVYLAEQIALAGRLVALKVSRALGEEPQSLARLQHAHIVPIHSVHDDPASGLRLMCMPYLGGANLAQVLEMAGAELPSRATGESLIQALDRVGTRLMPSSALPGSRAMRASTAPARGASGPRGAAATRGVGTPSRARSLWRRYLAKLPVWQIREAGPGSGALSDPEALGEDPEIQPARQFFRSHTYVQAAVWIAARLAEALDHAHTRGLLHRDLKPSNVLIAADGTPMLLDFNLSADIFQTDGASRAMLGGTLPYMSPEHLDAFDPKGTTPPEAVDTRSDLYSLGLILFEMVAGHHPFPDPDQSLPLTDALSRMIAERRRGAPSARESNPTVARSLDAILRKCLEPDPERRYQRAGDFAEDLRRYLDDRPLLHTADPSVSERVVKWFRRHPEARSSTTVGLVAMALILGFGALAWLLSDRFEAASAALKRKQFEAAFRECQILLNTANGPTGHLRRGLALADGELASYGAYRPEHWGESPSVRRLAPVERINLAEDLSELILLRCRASVALAARDGPESSRRQALEDAVAWLGRAQAIDPHPSAVLYEDRARYLQALGEEQGADANRKRAVLTQPKSARDFYLLGTALAAQRKLDAAEGLLGRAVALDSRRFWAWFALGLCHYDQGRYHEAAADFAACTILSPAFAWPQMNRGLALAKAGRLEEARAAYDRALEVSPDFVEALINRALCLLELDKPDEARRDLDRAVALGRSDPPILAARAEALSRSGRPDEALRDFNAAIAARPRDPGLLIARAFFLLKRDPSAARADLARAQALAPNNPRALLGLAHLLRDADPRAALASADRALALDPRLTDALQLRALIRAHLGDPAAAADADLLAQTPSPYNLYNAACALAVLSRTTRDARLLPRALSLLRRAVEAGFPTEGIASDPDLVPLRVFPEFQSLITPAEPGRHAP